MADQIFPCRFGDGRAVALFAMDEGCVCFPDDRRQSLCPQHILRASPCGSMELVQLLVPDPEGVLRRWLAGRNSAWAIS